MADPAVHSAQAAPELAPAGSAATLPSIEPASTDEAANRLADDLGMHDVVAGRRRLEPAEALRLLNEAPLPALGRWATAMAERIHGPIGSPRTYVIDRNINYTNVCSAHCTFCAFRRDETDHDAYVLTRDQLRAKVQELVDVGGTQVLLQGGMHPRLGLDFYLDMLRGLKQDFPQVHLHAFSPPEVVEFVAVLDLPGHPTTEPNQSHTLAHDAWIAKLTAVLSTLRDAGLASIPGGGGEIFGHHVRRRIGLGKATAQQWLDVLRVAHRVGLNTSTTMMFGHIEGLADRIDHMARVRDLQDEALGENRPGRVMAFISWPFQPDHTPLGDLPRFDPDHPDAVAGQSRFPGDVLAEAVFEGRVDPFDKKQCGQCAPRAGKVLRLAGAAEYLRTQAVSRLFLDNVHSIGASWVTMGPRIGQLGLRFGASDMGSVMMEENVVSAAGTTYCLDEAMLCRLIRDAGYLPAQRDNAYRILKTHPAGDPASPDLAVEDWSTLRPGKADQAPTEAPAVALTVGVSAESPQA
ncbi:MAG: radical SAM protein [Planctomycetota bacterium]